MNKMPGNLKRQNAYTNLPKQKNHGKARKTQAPAFSPEFRYRSTMVQSIFLMYLA